MDHLESAPSEPSTPVYAIFSSASPHVIYTNSIKEARNHLSTPELRDSGGRFKTFSTLKDGESYFSQNPVSTLTSSNGTFTRNEDGYRSPHPKLPPQLHSKFMKLIESNKKNDEVIKCMDENPHYYIDMAIDQPTILQQGCRYNAMHICARSGNLFIAMEIMKRVKDLQYISTIYQSDANVENTSAILIDRFLNNPDKPSGRSPLLWAARRDHFNIVVFLSSFLETQLPGELQMKELRRDCVENNNAALLLDCLRHPSQLYCVTLYKEKNDLDITFIAITSRFPFASIPANQKQIYFQMMPCSFFSGRSEDGKSTIRVSKDICGFKKQNNNGNFETFGSSFVPFASIGVFADKESAIKCYKTWSSEFLKSQDPLALCDHSLKAAVRLADSQKLFVFCSNINGLVIPSNRMQLFNCNIPFKVDDALLLQSLNKLGICDV